MFRILESQAPAKQTATDTIDVLSNRLQSATLLEDRRAAIQGLRSFAKLYPASVASGGLRSLISSLRNDSEDVDTIKVVLETLLMLFTPDESSPEASGEIALWLADEFTQRQDNITTLLNLLEAREFYSRLYSLQLISHICSARPERTQECIFTAPLGISKLVSVLTDAREPVRNEALVLLIALTPASEELQKLVAFENAFEILFSLIEAEGALTHGTEVVEDCLSLLAQLLRFNVSNQSFFRETGCVKRVTQLLHECQQEPEDDEAAPQWTLVHRDKNVWGLLAIIQLFLIRGGMSTPINQTAFWQNGVTEQVLSIAFGQRFSVSVTSKALSTCADLIRGNSPLQERFGDIEVLWGSYSRGDKAANGNVIEPLRINVIEAFLKLSLAPAPNNLLDARLAACECMKAFFAHHPGIRMHVLRRAIEGHTSGQDQIPNILSVLLTAPEARGNADPYQVWMACVLMFHLLFDDAEAKATAMAVTEGDAESGEEVVTSVQSVVGNLITGLQRGDDERITVGYLMLLCGWLFEDPDVVNDLLGEGSCIQTLLQEIKHQRTPSKLVPGLCTVLLGVIYEFSTKDSPIPRITLHKLLIEQLGREQYIDKITRLREYPLVRDFEVLPQTAGGQLEGGLPEVFFDRSFVEFLKDNFSRLLRAIDREPGFEISIVANGVEKGISRDLVDSLRAEIEDRTQILQTLESDLVSLQRRLDQEQLDHRKTKESNAIELSKVQQSNQSLQQRHVQELSQQLSKLENEHKHHKDELLKHHGDQLRAIDHQLKQASAESASKSNKAKELREHHDREVASLQQTIGGLESEISRIQEQHTKEVATLTKKLRELETIISQSNEVHGVQVADLQKKIQDLEISKKSHKDQVDNLNKTIQELQGTISQSKEAHGAQVAGLENKIQDLENTKKANDGQVADLNKKIKDFESTKGTHDGEVADLTKKLQSLESTLAAAKQNHEAEVSDYKSKVKTLESTLSTTKQQYEAESTGHNKTVGTLESNLAAATKEHEAEIATLKQSVAVLESDLAKAQKSSNDLETTQKGTASQISALEARAKEAENKAGEAESQARRAAETLKNIQAQLDKAKTEVEEKEEARQLAQSELEDLLIVFGDLEAKRTEDKKRLKELGEEVSEAEDDDDDEDEEDE
ncbi:Armadillo-like helical [Penicillium italicum]|uniref:Armadillo-like helical n=1 Tax=Penicillium italicum TaxID=40296 RepID=A0A0A2LC32_PENIT|nr:Armadillo-like helical [Penicillium italicum]